MVRPSVSPAEADEVTELMALAVAASSRQDWDAALAIWVRHAHAGNVRAQAEIGRCFVNGWGVPRDTDLALKWLTLSAKAGDVLGQRLLGDYYFNGEDGAPQRSIAEE